MHFTHILKKKEIISSYGPSLCLLVFPYLSVYIYIPNIYTLNSISVYVWQVFPLPGDSTPAAGESILGQELASVERLLQPLIHHIGIVSCVKGQVGSDTNILPFDLSFLVV